VEVPGKEREHMYLDEQTKSTNQITPWS